MVGFVSYTHMWVVPVALSIDLVLAIYILHRKRLRSRNCYARVRDEYLKNTHRFTLLNVLLIISVTINVAAVLVVFIYYSHLSNIPSTPTIEELSEKIERISKELSISSKELMGIQTELENRIETVEALKEEAEIAENVISLTDEQVKAIQAKLNQELAASNGHSTIVSIIINTVFFALGLIVPLIIRFIKNKWGKQQQPTRTKMELYYSEDEIEQAIELLKTIERKAESKE